MSILGEGRNDKESWFFGDSSSSPATSPTAAYAKRQEIAALDVVIGAKCFISGALQLEGRCLIDGTVEGEITSTGELVIGESATVKARITGENIRVHGRVVGDIECGKRLELKSGANVTGNINAVSLTIEDGVMYQGYCSMTRQTVALTNSIERSTISGGTDTTQVVELAEAAPSVAVTSAN